MIGRRPLTVAYLASNFPAPSETFVYREVFELQRRGWSVCTFSLYPHQKTNDNQLDESAARTEVLYAQPLRLACDIAREAARHPLRTVRTLGRAVMDALSPGEPSPWLARSKLVPQAIAALALARRLRRRRVRHLHCHFAHAPTTIGMYAAMQTDIAFSFTGHANDIFQRRFLLRKKLERAGFVAAISLWHQDFYAEIAPARREALRLIRCGVDVETWRPDPKSTTDSQQLRILTVCRLVEKKGIDMLIRALAELRDRHGIPSSLTIAGDGPERQRLARLARELGCDDSIRWLGSIDNARVRRLLAESDLFVLPCCVDQNGDCDGIPVVLMEAMACGVAVVAGDLPAIRELIRHNVNGALVNATDVRHVGNQLANLYRDRTGRQQLAHEGRRRVETEFSLRGNVDRLEQAFHDTMAA